MIEYIPFQEVRTALYQRLQYDLTPTPVFPLSAPQQTQFPYIVLKYFAAENPTTKTGLSHEILAIIEICHTWEGLDSVMQLQNNVLKSITRAPLDLPNGYQDVAGLGSLELAEHFASFDGERTLVMGIIKYRFRIQIP